LQQCAPLARKVLSGADLTVAPVEAFI
jgi:hypothetical protein